MAGLDPAIFFSILPPLVASSGDVRGSPPVDEPTRNAV
jgi:hypothetical protein